jgi:outer membrane protein OmpA-like peptidoglycan-associated protein
VHNFLKKNGVDRSNFTIRGMGNNEMIYPNAQKVHEMQKNMRVEFVIVE